ncbi:MAG: gamma-glutamyl-gamma-aminobutyrate hydrolase family protein [Chloroflexi bacterium]|nr:gamma-glutamyl-gamma-aminobutyrate hydrolase family protein [Chloroflexota bacterium]
MGDTRTQTFLGYLPAHEVRLEPSSRLVQILLQTDRLPVNSLHHQGIKQVAPPLMAAGYADDGLVEVLEARDHPFGLGVQWHPEDLIAEQDASRKMFAAFVEAAGNGHSGK